MARIVSFSVFRGAAYASTSNYYSEEGRINRPDSPYQDDRPASDLPEIEPTISKRAKRRRVSHIALSGFASGRIGEPTTQDSNAGPSAFEGGAEL